MNSVLQGIKIDVRLASQDIRAINVICYAPKNVRVDVPHQEYVLNVKTGTRERIVK